MMHEIRPCPFCGGEASGDSKVTYSDNHVKEQGWSQSTFFYVNCMSCGAGNKGIIGHRSREKAIGAWNRRARSAITPAEHATNETGNLGKGLPNDPDNVPKNENMGDAGGLTPLDWSNAWGPDGDGDEAHTAPTPFGNYTVERMDGRWTWRYCFDEHYDEDKFECESFEDGKDGAQAHWNERVSSIVSPAAASIASERTAHAETKKYLSAAAYDYSKLLNYLETAYQETDAPLPFEEAFSEAAKECRETSEFLRMASEGRDVSAIYEDELTKSKLREEAAEARIAELAAENERQSKLLAGRDNFIVDQGLWGDFVASLSTATQYLASTCAWKAKALEWKDISADTPFGCYTVADLGFDDAEEWHWTFHCYPYGSPDETKYETEAAAKAAAQADFDRRAMSVIETTATHADFASVDPTAQTEPDFARSIASVIREASAGGAAVGWRPCTGCHETNEGYETGHYYHSPMFGCHVGTGCDECGGIGVTWEYWSKDALTNMAQDAEADVPDSAAGSMTPEENRLEDLKQMAKYDGQIVSFEVREPYYLVSCDHCGWVGSSEHCGSDSYGDDSDVFCPRCHASGADCGKVAARITAVPTTPEGKQEPVTEAGSLTEPTGIGG